MKKTIVTAAGYIHPDDLKNLYVVPDPVLAAENWLESYNDSQAVQVQHEMAPDCVMSFYDDAGSCIGEVRAVWAEVWQREAPDFRSQKIRAVFVDRPVTR